MVVAHHTFDKHSLALSFSSLCPFWVVDVCEILHVVCGGKWKAVCSLSTQQQLLYTTTRYVHVKPMLIGTLFGANPWREAVCKSCIVKCERCGRNPEKG